MAKKSTKQSSQNRDITKFCAFWSLAIASILFVVTAILNIIKSACNIENGTLSLCISIFDIVAKVALLIAIGIPAYSYVKGRGKGWKIFFWFALLIYALGIVFSVIHF